MMSHNVQCGLRSPNLIRRFNMQGNQHSTRRPVQRLQVIAESKNADPETQKYRTKRHMASFSKNTADQKRPSKTAPDVPIARQGSGDTSAFFSSKTWNELGANENMIQALDAINVTKPSQIQAAAFKAVNGTAPHVLLADYAGSGKTLAYLVPLVQRLKIAEAEAGRPVTTPHAPSIIVVTPTAELCNQVLRVCRGLSSTLKFRSGAATGGRPMKTQRDLLAEGVDLIIGTPGRLSELLAAGDLTFDNCQALVLDEADILLAEASEFQEQVVPLQTALRESRAKGQTVFVTATIPADLYAEIEESHPGLIVAMGPRLHRLGPNVTENLIDCSGGDEVTEESGLRRKSVALLASLQEMPVRRTIVFCNKIENCRSVENFLNRSINGVSGERGPEWKILPFHAAITPERRSLNLTEFLIPPSPKDNTNIVLVCTDRASRGVDSAFVDHVVLFDFPRDPSEYVRRVGRTGRGAGGQGVVTVMALGRQVKLAKAIMGMNEKNRPVHQVPSVLPGAIIE